MAVLARLFCLSPVIKKTKVYGVSDRQLDTRLEVATNLVPTNPTTLLDTITRWQLPALTR